MSSTSRGSESSTGAAAEPSPGPSRFGRADPIVRVPRFEPVDEPVQKPRRWRLVLSGCAVGLLLGMGGGWAAAHATGDESRAVLVVTRDLPAGAVITEQDVGSAELDTGDVAVLGAESVGDAVGRVLRAPVEAAAPLTPAVLTAAPRPGAGQVLVPLALPAGQAPVRALAPGARVRAVAVIPAALTAPTSREGAAVAADLRKRLPRPGSTLVAGAVVATVHLGAPTPSTAGDQSGASGALVVELVVAAKDAPALLAAAQSQAVTLVLTEEVPSDGEQGQ